MELRKIVCMASIACEENFWGAAERTLLLQKRGEHDDMSSFMERGKTHLRARINNSANRQMLRIAHLIVVGQLEPSSMTGFWECNRNHSSSSDIFDLSYTTRNIECQQAQ
jgi:hypothetical protein